MPRIPEEVINRVKTEVSLVELAQSQGYVLQKSGGNVSEAARMLCLERAYLHRLMRKLGVQRDVVVQ